VTAGIGREGLHQHRETDDDGDDEQRRAESGQAAEAE